jgi:xeroderma pigmentosum group C-complementing protein
VGQYALFQTELYIPPPVIGGRIPKNAFGNLDVYVPSMVPPGAVHIRSLEAKNAARLLNIDYADAVTGFQFKGRHGTAVINGIVVATEFQEAIEAVIGGFADARSEALEEHLSSEALRMWKRFFHGLRIVDRLKGYRKSGDVDEEDRYVDEEFEKELADEDLQRQIEEEMELYEESETGDGGGGFLIDHDEEHAIPTVRSYFRHDDSNDADDPDESGGLLPQNHDEGTSLLRRNSSFGLEHFQLPAEFHRTPNLGSDDGGFLPSARKSGGDLVDGDLGGGFASEHNEGGGFLSDPDEGGCFLPGSDNEEPATPRIDPVPLVAESSRAVIEKPLVSKEENLSNLATSGMDSIAPTPPSEENINKQDAMMDGAHHNSPTREPGQYTTQPPAECEHEEISPSPAPEWERGSSFDESMPLEDPDDEDAEPEWLL